MPGPAGRVTKLTDIETLGVALVTRGANRKKFGVKKSDDEGDEMSLTVAQKIAQVITKGELPLDDDAFAAKCKEVGLTDPQAIEAAKALVKIASAYQDMGAFEKFVSEVLPQMVSGHADGGQSEPKGTTDAKTQPDPKEPPPGKTGPADTPSGGNKPPAEGETKDYAGQKKDPEKEPPMSTQKDDKTQAGAEGAGNGATTGVAKSAEQQRIEGLEALLKSQQEGFKAQLDALQKQAKDAADAQLLKDWVQKAKEDLKFVPGKSAQELGQLLFDTQSKVSKEAAEAHFAVLKASSTALEKSALFTPTGARPNGATSPDGNGTDALSQIAKSAQVLLEKSDILKTETREMEGLNGKVKTEIQKAMAVQKALELQPELYDAYLREHPAQSGNRYAH